METTLYYVKCTLYATDKKSKQKTVKFSLTMFFRKERNSTLETTEQDQIISSQIPHSRIVS